MPPSWGAYVDSRNMEGPSCLQEPPSPGSLLGEWGTWVLWASGVAESPAESAVGCLPSYGQPWYAYPPHGARGSRVHPEGLSVGVGPLALKYLLLDLGDLPSHMKARGKASDPWRWELRGGKAEPPPAFICGGPQEGLAQTHWAQSHCPGCTGLWGQREMGRHVRMVLCSRPSSGVDAWLEVGLAPPCGQGSPRRSRTVIAIEVEAGVWGCPAGVPQPVWILRGQCWAIAGWCFWKGGHLCGGPSSHGA